MGKFISTTLMILGFLFLVGACEDCDGCDGCADCGFDCSGGIDCTSGCSSCDDEVVYHGDITVKIHTWDDTVITLNGHRNGGSGAIYRALEDYSHDTRVGYAFGGLYGTINGRTKYVCDSYGDLYYSSLDYVKDGETVDIYEEWHILGYDVRYVLNNDEWAYRQYSYSIGNAIIKGIDIENHFNSELADRKTAVGYTAYYYSTSGIVEFDWNFGGTFNESIINCYSSIDSSKPYVIFVKQKMQSNKVNVKFNYNYIGENNVAKPSKTLSVDFDENLDRYFTDEIQDENKEFLGWFTDVELTQKVPSEIGVEYETDTLNLYAKYLEFKEIYVDFQDGTEAVKVRIYEDESLSIDVNRPGKIFYGLSDTPGAYSRLPFASIVSGQTYYVAYIE